MQRVGPVLDADPLAVEGVLGVGDVAGGEHARRAGLEALVDEDPVVDGEPGLGRELGARLHADADDHEVAVERRARRWCARARPPWSPSNAVDAGAEQHPHAVVGVDVAVDRAHLGPQHPLERDRGRLDDGHVEAALPRGSGDLGADPARADHDDRAAAVQSFAQGIGILDAAQVVARRRGRAPAIEQPPRLGPGGEQQPVVAQPLAVVERRARSSRCPGSSPCGRAAARCRARRRSPRRGRRPCSRPTSPRR